MVLPALYSLLKVALLLLPTTFAFDYVGTPVTAFSYGDRTVRVWPLAENGPRILPSRWGFRYDPVILPLSDNNGIIVVTRNKMESKWRTDLVLSFDDADLKAKAFESVQELFPKTVLKNVLVLPVKRIVIRIPAVMDDFPDVNLTSTATPCPRKASCFSFYDSNSRLRVSFLAATEARGLELENALRSAQIHYEIHSHAKLSQAQVNVNDDENPIQLDTVYGYFDMLSTPTGSPSVPLQTAEVEKKLATVESTFLTSFNKTESQLESVNTRFQEFADSLAGLFRNLTAERLDQTAHTTRKLGESQSKIEAIRGILESAMSRLDNVTLRLG